MWDGSQWVDVRRPREHIPNSDEVRLRLFLSLSDTKKLPISSVWTALCMIACILLFIMPLNIRVLRYS